MNSERELTSSAPSHTRTKGLIRGILIVAPVAALLTALAYWGVTFLLTESQLLQKLDEAKKIITVWDILAMPVLIIVVLGMHEIGHLIGGISRGMRFLLLIVGPFGWHASVSGVRFEWNTNVALMGGLAATLPTAVGPNLRRQLLTMIASGPLASLLLSILAIALASFTDLRLTAYLTFVAVTSVGIFMVTLIPTNAGGFMSDGMQFIDVIRGGNAVIERSALMQIFAQSLNGVRPRDWDTSAMDALSKIESEDPLRHSGAALYLLARAMDCQHSADIERYRVVLENSVDSFPSGFKQSVYVELAICAWLAGDTDVLRRHLDRSKGGIVEKSRRLLAQSALAKLEGRSTDCERDRLLAIKALADATDAGEAQLTKDQLEMLR